MSRGALVAGLLISWIARSAVAQGAAEVAELVVHGPAGAVLSIDGEVKGTLPLMEHLSVPAGPHRFQLAWGNKKRLESDILNLPCNRQSELNLSLSRRSLVAVLRIPSGVLLLLRADQLPSQLRSSVTAAVAAAATDEHTVLVEGQRQASLPQSPELVARCIEQGQCAEPLFPEGQVSYVMSLRLSPEGTDEPPTYQLEASMLDIRTRDLSARAAESCVRCDARMLATRVAAVATSLLQTTVTRPRGTLVVNSTPPAARVVVDGRWLGLTPFQREVFADSHRVELQLDGWQSHKEAIQVEAGATATVEASLAALPHLAPVEVRKPAPARPLWRIVTGSALIGGGLLLGGFGVSALLADGQCQDGSSNFTTCPRYYSTAGVGGGFLGVGAAFAVAGSILIAVPKRR